MPDPAPDLATALADAVGRIRSAVRDRTATVGLLVPGEANGVLARQTLALAGPVIRVEPWTADGLVRHLGELALAGRRPEPAGWRQATLGVLVRQLAAAGALDPHGATLTLPGWRDTLADALSTLEAGGVDADHLRPHAPLLATVLQALADRRREERLYAPHELAAAALAGVDAPSPAGRIAGVVVLGDSRLTAPTFAVVRAFLADRPVVRVATPPLDALPPEPTGLVAAAPHATVLAVAPPRGALGALSARLFRPDGPPVVPDGTLALARAPDDVREVREAARAVQDAILAGTSLDRIAIALPTTEHARVWRAELDRAGLPATWLTGPPLADEPTARFVQLICAVASGDDTVRRWYELLRQPGLRLRARLGPPGTTGRGRWRRILQSCGAVAGTDAVVRAVAAWGRASEVAEDQAAAASLALAIGALSAELALLRPPAPLGTHAARLDDLLGRWWARSRDREQVRQLLRGWAASTAGFPFTLAEAADELAQAFAGTPALEGELGDAAIRVLSPMALLGGTFELVVLPGLAHGRFPAEPRESPLLPDALAERLGLPTSARVRAEDRRRFGAAVASCRARLVLSWPETDFLDGKPRLPGELALDAAAAFLGRRAGYRDAEALAARTGSRARPHVDDPERALGVAEFLLALTAQDPRAAVGWLAADSGTRRQLALHRSPWREARDAWSGAVPPEVLRCEALGGAPLTVGALAELLRDPAFFFFRRMLGAWPAHRLPDGLDLLDPGGIRDRLVGAVRAAMASAGPLDDAVRAEWTRALDLVPDVAAEDRELADALADAGWRDARGHLGALRGPTLDLPPTGLADDLPWVVEGRVGLLAGDAVVELVSKARKPALTEQAGPLLAALAASRAGHDVARAVSAGLDAAHAVELVLDDLRDRLREAADRAGAGEWAWGASSKRFRLSDEGPDE